MTGKSGTLFWDQLLEWRSKPPRDGGTRSWCTLSGSIWNYQNTLRYKLERWHITIFLIVIQISYLGINYPYRYPYWSVYINLIPLMNRDYQAKYNLVLGINWFSLCREWIDLSHNKRKLHRRYLERNWTKETSLNQAAIRLRKLKQKHKIRWFLDWRSQNRETSICPAERTF